MSILIQRINRYIFVQEQNNLQNMALLRGEVESSVTIIVLQIGVCAVLEEERNNVVMVVMDGPHERRRVGIPAGGVDVGAVGEEELAGTVAVVDCGPLYCNTRVLTTNLYYQHNYPGTITNTNGTLGEHSHVTV